MARIARVKEEPKEVVLPPLTELNLSELLEMIRLNTGLRLNRGVSKNRLIYLIESGDKPDERELAGTWSSRKQLQMFIEKSWDYVQSQLPCKGENRGKCTIYPCPEGRHLDCYVANREHLIAMGSK